MDCESVEDYLRNEIRDAWRALQDAGPDSAAYGNAFVRYCRALHESSLYAIDGKLPALVRDGLPVDPNTSPRVTSRRRGQYDRIAKAAGKKGP